MKFASVRLITDDVDRLVSFYELLTGLTFRRPVPLFGELVTEAGTLAIGSSSTIPLFPGSGLQAADNRSAIIEFQVENVDADYDRIKDQIDVVQPPTTMPWGNRALLLIDPDGNRVNLYTPATAEAQERFADRA